MSFWGELYLRSTQPFLDEGATEREVDYLARHLGQTAEPGPVLDLGCGHGRHAAPLQARLGAAGHPVVGVDLDALSLAERLPGFTAIRADFRRLPFRDCVFSAAYAWYSTLFTFEDSAQAALFAEVCRVLRPGGMLVLETVPLAYAAARPPSRFEETLPNGYHLVEEAAFDPRLQRDRLRRTLRRPDGTVLSGEVTLRYYAAPSLMRIFRQAGFAVRWMHGGLDGAPYAPMAPRWVLGVVREQP